MEATTNNRKERKYFIDWLRIGLIISVFFFHVGMIFRPEHWHVNSEETFAFLDPIMWWLHLWRMPLLFLVSGIGTYYALGRRTSWQYVKERFRRLYIPFAAGFFLLVPVQIYIERIDIYDSLWSFYPHMFDNGVYPVGNISWHHLWFIVYLFLISMIVAPFLRFTKTAAYKKLRIRLISAMSRKLGLNWLLVVLIGSQWILRQYWPDSTHALLNDWAYFTYYMLFFISGFMLFTSDKLIGALTRQRRLYLVQTLAFTVLLFTLRYILPPVEYLVDVAYGITEITIALSCGLTAIGYFKAYFNKENRFRKILNEAIYPFYLLHQPVLVVIGYIVLQWNISTGLQAILITLISLVVIYVLYWYVIRRWNPLRLIFGLKMKMSKPATVEIPEESLQLQPVVERND